jgi:hypothetical protein
MEQGCHFAIFLTGDILATIRYEILGGVKMKVIATLAAIAAAATIVAGASAAPTSKGSSPYVCGYGKSGKSGSVYLVLGVEPRSIGPAKCKEFNSGFKGTPVNVHKQLGTGKVYCKYKYTTHTEKLILAAFASKNSLGKAFCSAFHAKGWKKF